MTYTELYNKFHRAVNSTKVPLPYDELRLLREQLRVLQQVAYDELKEPEREILKAYTLFNDKIKACRELRNIDSTKITAIVKEIESNDYIDPVTPELDATANAQALLYITEIAGAGSDTYKIQKIAEKALSTREGAMALLRAEASQAISKKIPRSYIAKAVEKSKSPEKIAFESKKQSELELASKKQAQAISESFKLGLIEKSISKDMGSLQGVIASREAERAPSFFSTSLKEGF